jgi:transposase
MVRMTKKSNKLAWTEKQLTVYKLAKEGKTYDEITEITGAAPSTISKVKNAIEKGQTPKDKYEPPKKKPQISNSSQPLEIKQANPLDVNVALKKFKGEVMKGSTTGSDEDTPTTGSPSPPASGMESGGKEKGYSPYKKPTGLAPSEALASLIKLVPVPYTCVLTPIMMNARFIAIKEFGWREDMPWENFFDTCLYYLFDAWGFTLQGYYKKTEEDLKKEQEEESTSNEGKKQGGNGKEPSFSEEDLKLVAALAQIIKQSKAK